MKICAVICEYNPFHTGHLYQLGKVPAGYDRIACVMSGNFVQRAEPAVADKYLRAETALLCGADIVVETALPIAHFVELCDEVWFVYTEEAVRIARLMETRGYSEEKARAMIHAQIPDDEYAAMADFVIDNSGSREETETTIREHLHEG